MTSPVPLSLRELLVAPHVNQTAFAWPRGRWLEWLTGVEGAADVLNELPETVNRADIAKVVNAKLSRGHVASGFISAMVWGYGDSGYGPYRTASVLTESEHARGRASSLAVLEKLERSVTILRDAGAVEAYRWLNNDGHIEGLGPAFFTKWLYFVSTTGDPHGERATPILNRLVMEWMDVEAGVQLRYARTADYARYCDVLTTWGQPFGRTPVQVEEGIFGVIRASRSNV